MVQSRSWFCLLYPSLWLLLNNCDPTTSHELPILSTICITSFVRTDWAWKYGWCWYSQHSSEKCEAEKWWNECSSCETQISGCRHFMTAWISDPKITSITLTYLHLPHVCYEESMWWRPFRKWVCFHLLTITNRLTNPHNAHKNSSAAWYQKTTSCAGYRSDP